jgi:hypothetical protein
MAATVPAPPAGRVTTMEVLIAEEDMQPGKATPRMPWPEETKVYSKFIVAMVPVTVALPRVAEVVPEVVSTKPQI